MTKAGSKAIAFAVAVLVLATFYVTNFNAWATLQIDILVGLAVGVVILINWVRKKRDTYN